MLAHGTLPIESDGVQTTAVKSFRPRTTYPGASYVLPSDAEEKTRLILQHYLLKRFFDGRNIVAPVELKAGDKMLEVATGTGIWILDVASTIPDSVELYGTDIEPGLFPDTRSRPRNTHFFVESTVSLPMDWSDTFSIVHQRLLVAGLTDSNWKKAIREMHRVLKPGGWIELCEFTEWNRGPISMSWWMSWQEHYKKIGLVLDCGKHLEQWLLEAGFIDISVVEVTKPIGAWAGEDGLLHRNAHMGAWKGMKPFLLNSGGVCGAKTEEELDEFFDDLQNEIDSYKGSFTWVKCIARKPE